MNGESPSSTNEDAGTSGNPDNPVAANPPRTASTGKAPAESAPTEQVFTCDLCGNVMLNLHCKLVCEQCGYKRDCSDP